MHFIKPFPGLRPKPQHIADIIAPPYDVVNRGEACILAKNKPLNFLHITRPEIDLPISTDPYSNIVYETGKNNFNTMITDGILEQDNKPCFYVYRLTTDNHQQTGLVATVSLNNPRIRKHELTRPKKELDRAKHMDALHAQTEPVLFAYKHQANPGNLLEEITKTTPIYAIDYQKIHHEFWIIDEDEMITRVSDQFNKLDTLYIADGHHRTAAAERIAEKYPNKPSCQYCLAVIFPDNQLQVLGYHRVIKDLNGLSPNEFLDNLANQFEIKVNAGHVAPMHKGQFGMYLQNQWYKLNAKSECINTKNMIDRLDVTLLENLILSPILNITDVSNDQRINFVGGVNGLNRLEECINKGDAAVAFSLFLTSLDELFAVSDQGKFMPPKSTWFEPKLADGLITYLL